MALTNDQILEAISAKSLMEVIELVKAMEEKFGVTAAAPVAVAAGAGRRRCRSGRRADRIRGHPQGDRRQEGRSHQGRPRNHGPGPEGSEGPGRGAPAPSRKPCQQGRRREDQEGSRSRRREGRDQVSGSLLRRLTQANTQGWGRKPQAIAVDRTRRIQNQDSSRQSEVAGTGVLVPAIPATVRLAIHVSSTPAA